MRSMAFIKFQNVVKDYVNGDIRYRAADNINFEIEKDEFVVILGPSGAGKTTLLNLIGGMDFVTEGSIFIDGEDITKYNEARLTEYRKDSVGFVFQFYNLIPNLTAYENVALIKAIKKDTLDIEQTLSMVGLKEHLNKFPSQLSGGEQQRVAIAIALANDPKLLLADEPTGSVDSRTAATILDVFRELNRVLGVTVVIVTHDRQISRKVDRVVAIRDGRTSSEFIRRRSYAEELAAIGDIGFADQSETHDELVVLDRAGRLQIPAEYMQALGLKGKNKVKVELEGDRVVVYAPKE